MTRLTTRQVENHLLASIRKDRSVRSRCSTTIEPSGTIITVQVSGSTYGLAIAVGARTGEEPMAAIERLGNEP